MPCKPISPKLKSLPLFLLIGMMHVHAEGHSGLRSRPVIGDMAQGQSGQRQALPCLLAPSSQVVTGPMRQPKAALSDLDRLGLHVCFSDREDNIASRQGLLDYLNRHLAQRHAMWMPVLGPRSRQAPQPRFRSSSPRRKPTTSPSSLTRNETELDDLLAGWRPCQGHRQSPAIRSEFHRRSRPSAYLRYRWPLHALDWVVVKVSPSDGPTEHRPEGPRRPVPLRSEHPA